MSWHLQIFKQFVMATSIEQLADEILLEIFEHLDFSSTINATLVCKR